MAFLGLLVSGCLLSPASIVRGSGPPEAQKEPVDAPIRGQLQFKSRKADFDGIGIGDEFDKRRYIVGHPDSPQRGIWQLETLPKSLTTAPGDVVLVCGGNGKVGQAATQIATAHGARVFGVERTREDYIGHASSPVRMIDASNENVAQVLRDLDTGCGAANQAERREAPAAIGRKIKAGGFSP